MQSLDEIYRQYARTVYKYLLSMVGNPDVAEDLTQETFYQAVKSYGKYDGSCKISTWLCGIAKNKFYEYTRKKSKESQHLVSFEDVTEDTWQGVPDNQTASSEESYLANVDKVTILQKLHLCPEPYKEVLYLRIFGDLSFKEIGEVMNKTENWARVTYYRGKERLKKEVTGNE